MGLSRLGRFFRPRAALHLNAHFATKRPLMMVLRCLVAAAFLIACAHNAEAPTETTYEESQPHVLEAPNEPGQRSTRPPLRAETQAEPENPRAAEALYDRGERLLAKGELLHAREAYAELAARFPLDAHAEAAKRRVAEVDLALKRFKDAEQSLKSLYPTTPPEERNKTARQL